MAHWLLAALLLTVPAGADRADLAGPDIRVEASAAAAPAEAIAPPQAFATTGSGTSTATDPRPRTPLRLPAPVLDVHAARASCARAVATGYLLYARDLARARANTPVTFCLPPPAVS